MIAIDVDWNLTELEREIVEATRDAIAERIAGLRCDEHGTAAGRVRLEQRGEDMHAVVSDVCCEAFKAKLETAMSDE